MSDPTVLARIRAATGYVSRLENQDQGLVIEMVEVMLDDAMSAGGLNPTEEYVRRYCDVLDDDESERLAVAAIDRMSLNVELIDDTSLTEGE